MKNNKTRRTTIIIVFVLIALALVLFFMSKRNNTINRAEVKTAKAEYTTKIGTQEIDITNLIEQNPVPKISAGMIRVKWNGYCYEIVSRDDQTWYNYKDGKPAYMMLNDGKYQSEIYYNMPQKKEYAYAEENIGKPITVEDLGSIYMWVPRFAYNEEEIIYIKDECTVAGTYTMPEIFEYVQNNKHFSLSGIWVEVNELTDDLVTAKKVTNLNKGEADAIYGFLANTKANAMTDGEQAAVKIHTEYMDKLNTNVGAVVPTRPDTTNTNHTIIKIIDTTKLEPIIAKATYNSSTKKIEVTVTQKSNNIEKIVNSKGKELVASNIDYTKANTGDETIGNYTYKFYVIDDIGNIKYVELTTSGLSVYVIPDLETLKIFRDSVNAGQTYKGITVAQVADIDINEGKHWTISETGVEEFAEDAEQWTPIGTSSSNCFQGTYEGGDYTISGLYINTTNSNQGLFKYLSGNIQKLNIEKSYVKAGSYSAGLVGYISGTSTIQNCKFNGKLECSNYAGGIVGYSSPGESYTTTIKNCEFDGRINATSSDIGGIIGYAYSGTVSIQNCSSKGSITSTSEAIGGIMGGLASDSINGYVIQSITITECKNEAIISGKSDIGGIIGYCKMYRANINKCCNLSKIIATNGNVGGIAGTNIYAMTYQKGTWDYYHSSPTAVYNYTKDCYNSGEIIATSGYAGGIIGVGAIVSNCYNIGNVSGTTSGGICGMAGRDNTSFYSANSRYAYQMSYNRRNYIEIEACYNYGKITGISGATGGIIGENLTNVTKCYNMGEVCGKGTYTGGIIGSNIRKGIGCDTNIKFYGFRMSITNCYNTGNISATKGEVGGICGYSYGSILYCYNLGNVTNNSGDAGGIVGNLNYNYVSEQWGLNGPGYQQINNNGLRANVQFSYNAGEVIGTSYTGGIIGQANHAVSGAISYLYNLGKVKGLNSSGYAGGVVGRLYVNYDSTGTIMSSAYNAGTVDAGNYGANVVASTSKASSSYKQNYYTSCYALKDVAPIANDNVTEYDTINQMPTVLSIVGSSFKEMEGRSYPALSWETENDNLSLINGDNVFIEDTNNINQGYPILDWQVN